MNWLSTAAIGSLEREASSAHNMHCSGFTSNPSWTNRKSCVGTQETKYFPYTAIHVSHGGTLSTSKKPMETYSAVPSARLSSAAYSRSRPPHKSICAEPECFPDRRKT